MAEVIQLLREYQLSGDREFLAQLWPKAKLALEYAWRPGGWDSDRDGVMEGAQHNTTDIAYYGPNPLLTFLYMAALKAGAVIARHLDDPEIRNRLRSACRTRRTAGRRTAVEWRILPAAA